MNRKWLSNVTGGGLTSLWLVDEGVLTEEDVDGLFGGMPDDDWYREVQCGPAHGLQYGLNYFIGRVAKGGKAYSKTAFRVAPDRRDTPEFIRGVFKMLKDSEWSESSLFTADQHGELVET